MTIFTIAIVEEDSSVSMAFNSPIFETKVEAQTLLGLWADMRENRNQHYTIIEMDEAKIGHFISYRNGKTNQRDT